MKKKLVMVIVIAGVAKPKPSIWEKMREGMEAMPEDFPPRVMFDNVAAIRENTEQILEALEKSSSAPELEPTEV
jgi:hypothetical protein